MSVYVRDGVRKSHFDADAYGKWDAHARSIFSLFFQSRERPWKVFVNDGLVGGNVDFDAADMRLVGPGGQEFLVEVETKLSGYTDKYLKSGVHFPWRKIQKAFAVKKYTPDGFLLGMTNKLGDDLLIVRGRYAYLAFQIWPEKAGYNNAKPTANFIEPEHGCFPLAKPTYRDRSKLEDFCSIDYNRVTRYSKVDGVWRLTKPSDGKYMSDN